MEFSHGGDPLVERRLRLDPSWRVTIIGQIKTLVGFGNQNLYVEYLINLPSGWATRRGGGNGTVTDDTYGVSWKGRPNPFPLPDEAEDVIHLSLPFQIDLFNRSRNPKMNQPQIFLRVTAVDVFGRETVVGYGSAFLPVTAGKHQLEVHTCKRVSVNPLDTMSMFFLGFIEEEEEEANGTTTITGSDVEVNGSPDGPNGTTGSNEPNNPFPSVTQTSGVVNLDLFALVRSDESLQRERMERRQLVASLQQVMEAFERAKRKVIEISQMIHDSGLDVGWSSPAPDSLPPSLREEMSISRDQYSSMASTSSGVSRDDGGGSSTWIGSSSSSDVEE